MPKHRHAALPTAGLTDHISKPVWASYALFQVICRHHVCVCVCHQARLGIDAPDMVSYNTYDCWLP
jgi:hypothetical protein